MFEFVETVEVLFFFSSLHFLSTHLVFAQFYRCQVFIHVVPHQSLFAEQQCSNSHSQQKALKDDEPILHAAVVQGLGNIDGSCEKKIWTFSQKFP